MKREPLGGRRPAPEDPPALRGALRQERAVLLEHVQELEAVQQVNVTESHDLAEEKRQLLLRIRGELSDRAHMELVSLSLAFDLIMTIARCPWWFE